MYHIDSWEHRMLHLQLFEIGDGPQCNVCDCAACIQAQHLQLLAGSGSRPEAGVSHQNTPASRGGSGSGANSVVIHGCYNDPCHYPLV